MGIWAGKSNGAWVRQGKKIATTKSRWDRNLWRLDDLIWEMQWHPLCFSVVSLRGGAWNCSPPQLYCSERSGRSAVANASPGRHNGEAQRETQQENDLKWEKLNSDHFKADEIGLVGVWRFDLGNLMAHGCGKGKIATTKSRWDWTCGDLRDRNCGGFDDLRIWKI